MVARGQLATRFKLGDRVGVPRLGGTCGHCTYCLEKREIALAQVNEAIAALRSSTLEGAAVLIP